MVNERDGRGGASERRVWTIPEVAARLGPGRNTAYRLAAAGKLPVPVIRAGGTLVDGRVVGGRLFVSKAELAKLLGEQPEQGGQPGGAR